MDDATLIAKGGQPQWTGTFEHPVHGELVFTARMPTGSDWCAQSVMQEELAPGGLSGASALLPASIAGLLTILKLPVLSERREEDPDVPGHVKIVQTFYDPREDPYIEFVTRVWLDFYRWRLEILSLGDKVKNSSGATSGDADGDSSPATTDSPQPTPASAT